MKFELAELKKRMQVRSTLAITLESGRIVVDWVRREEKSERVLRSITLPVGAEAVLADPDGTGKRLLATLIEAQIAERRCVVSVPVGWALTTSTEVPRLAPEDLRAFLELRAERDFPIPVPDLRLSHCSYLLPDGGECATVVAVPSKRLDLVMRMLASGGLRAASISLGLDGCLPRNGIPAALHFFSNCDHVDVVIAAGGGIAALRSLPSPNHSESAGLATIAFSREVRITLGRLPQTLRQQVIEARFAGLPIPAGLLCAEMRPHLERLGIESRLAVSGDDPTVPPGRAVESARQFLQQKPVAFELLAPQVNQWQSFARNFEDRRRRWLITALATLLIALALTSLIRSRMESSLNEEWKGMSRKVADLENLQQRIRLFRPWFEPTPQNLQIVEGLAAAFPDSGEVWAKSVQITDGTKVTCVGFARNQPAVLAFLERLRSSPNLSGVQVQQERGENPIQFSIIYKSGVNDAK